jgi:hypothetical protein
MAWQASLQAIAVQALKNALKTALQGDIGECGGVLFYSDNMCAVSAGCGTKNRLLPTCAPQKQTSKRLAADGNLGRTSSRRRLLRHFQMV